ncbi:MAG: hypothetical protein V1645_02795 [archaeon]
MNIKVLNKKEVKRVVKSLEEDFLIKDLKLDYVFILGADDKVFLVDKGFAGLDLSKLRVNSVGMYFGQLQDGRVRLSIEGSQIVGPLAKRNVVELSKGQVEDWIRGVDVDLGGGSGLVIVKYGEDFYGSGKISKGLLLNFVPKSRRIKVLSP